MISRRKCIVAGLPVLFAIFSYAIAAANTVPPLPNFVSGEVRVQLLSDSLVRLELKGPAGFEDRATFHIVDRNWPGTKFVTNVASNETVISTANYVIRVPENATALKGIRIESGSGETLYTCDGALENSRWLPSPSEKPAVWSFADAPRLIPPAWGLTPAPADAALPETSGWDLRNDAPDIYVFIPGGDYRRLRRDFLKLTGPTEMPPLFAFGTFDSRWYDYSESTALKQIDDYRQRKIPLDVLVIDTGWRQNASTGYQPNTKLLPDMSRFFQRAHAKHVRVMFNDHPEPKAKTALDPSELKFRYDGLTGLLNQGLDFWWFDRNWVVALVPPMPNLRKEVWGMQLYHDITQQVRPEARPLIMANVDGIDNGIRKHAPDAAAHRFSIQWTGDTGPSLDFLRRGVENAVYSGSQALFPYMSEDLGGHTTNPTTEGYIRWIEYGALSPVYRPHCTHNLERMPWSFGPKAENVARRFLNMRYRLLPVFYAAAHENYETGEPVLRRLDLDYPEFAEASRNDEYLISKGILVAPILQEQPLKPVPADWLKTAEGQLGLAGEYFNNETLSGTSVLARIDSTINFNWGNGSPDPRVNNDYFSARWTGSIQVPQDVGDVFLTTVEDDGARLWLDGKQVIDAWGGHDSARTEASSVVSAGKPHPLRLDYQELQFGARVQLQYRPAAARTAMREIWIPPGVWIDAWSGHSVTGPTTVTNAVSLEEIPVYIKSGTILPLAPEMQYTGQSPWSPITLDLYPRAGDTSQTTLYEDDTLTTAYQRGQFRKTLITLSADEAKKTVLVKIGGSTGSFSGALKQRAWVLRIHRPADWPENLAPTVATINERKVSGFRKIARNDSAMPFGDKTGAPDGDVFELKLPATSVTAGRQVEISFAPKR
jgi:hypothetical protein